MRRAALFLVLAVPLAAAPKEIVLDHDDIEVAEDVVVKSGTYCVSDDGDGVIHVKADGVTIDFQGATLAGSKEGSAQDACTGIGVWVEGHKGVTIRNAVMSGFKAAIVASHCQDITIEGCDFHKNYATHLHSTPERGDESDWLFPHENDDLRWRKSHGAGISLEDCEGGALHDNNGRAQQNGILLTRCAHVKVYDNDMSYLSGWGLAMYRTCDCVVSHNSFDWCVRGFSDGKYARGCDSADILVFEQCCRNTFAYNSATHGGDGFFLYAGNETTQRTGKGGCNGNLVYKNDFSHAVANGIEATFSDGNVFAENILDECDYGIWGGYSYNTYIAGNRITRSLTAGIAIEHGHANVIEGNVFEDNARAVSLWADPNPELEKGAYGKTQDTSSRGYVISNNHFEKNRQPNSIRNTTDVQQDQAEGDVTKRSRKIDPPDVPGKRDAFLPVGHPRGRKYMIIDEWGPYDFAAPKAFPVNQAAWGEATVFVLGPEASFTVEGVTEGTEVAPASGKLPATLKVRRSDSGGLSLRPFRFSVRAEGTKEPLAVAGTLLSAKWDLSYWTWTKDPRGDAEAWKALLATPPLKKETIDRLDYMWQGGGPEGVPRAHFGALATTDLELPAGKYTFRTVSDDGIRLWVDGKLLIENWTQHGPTEDRKQVDLADGKHSVRVEYFQIDGWCALCVSFARAGD